MNQPRDNEWSNRDAAALRGLAEVIRERGTCPPMALETIADKLETTWPYGWVDPKTLSFINHETKVKCGPSCKEYTIPVYTNACHPIKAASNTPATDLFDQYVASVNSGWGTNTDLTKPPVKESDNWVLVPRDPTTAMFDAGFAAIEKQYHAERLDDCVAKVNATWFAMLRAAAIPSETAA